MHLQIRHAAQFVGIGARQKRRAHQHGIHRQRHTNPAAKLAHMRLQGRGRPFGHAVLIGRGLRVPLGMNHPRLFHAPQHRPFQTGCLPANACDPRQGHL